MIHWVFDLDNTLYTLDSDINIHRKKKKKNKSKDKKSNGDLFLDYSIIQEDTHLNKLIPLLKGRKVIMTNSIQIHCDRVLNRLKIKHHFNKLHYRNTGVMKPLPMSYYYVMKENEINLKDGDQVIFFDDMPINLQMAKKFGWITVLINHNIWAFQGNKNIDFVFPSIKQALVYFIKKSNKIN